MKPMTKQLAFAAFILTSITVLSFGIRHIYMFANISPRTIDTHARLRGRVQADFWNPHTGEISQAECAHEVEADMDVTVVPVTLAPFKSVFVVGGR